MLQQGQTWRHHAIWYKSITKEKIWCDSVPINRSQKQKVWGLPGLKTADTGTEHGHQILVEEDKILWKHKVVIVAKQYEYTCFYILKIVNSKFYNILCHNNTLIMLWTSFLLIPIFHTLPPGTAPKRNLPSSAQLWCTCQQVPMLFHSPNMQNEKQKAKTTHTA